MKKIYIILGFCFIFLASCSHNLENSKSTFVQTTTDITQSETIITNVETRDYLEYERESIVYNGYTLFLDRTGCFVNLPVEGVVHEKIIDTVWSVYRDTYDWIEDDGYSKNDIRFINISVHNSTGIIQFYTLCRTMTKDFEFITSYDFIFTFYDGRLYKNSYEKIDCLNEDNPLYPNEDDLLKLVDTLERINFNIEKEILLPPTGKQVDFSVNSNYNFDLLDETEIIELKQAYCESMLKRNTNSEYLNVLSSYKNIGLLYFGDYNGTKVCYFNSKFSFSMGMSTYITLDGISIYVGSGETLYCYHNNQLYSFLDAFERGFLVHSDIEKIADLLKDATYIQKSPYEK